MQDVLTQNAEAKPNPSLVTRWCSDLVMAYFVHGPPNLCYLCIICVICVICVISVICVFSARRPRTLVAPSRPTTVDFAPMCLESSPSRRSHGAFRSRGLGEDFVLYFTDVCGPRPQGRKTSHDRTVALALRRRHLPPSPLIHPPTHYSLCVSVWLLLCHIVCL
jgi:hypothetical protein